VVVNAPLLGTSGGGYGEVGRAIRRRRRRDRTMGMSARRWTT